MSEHTHQQSAKSTTDTHNTSTTHAYASKAAPLPILDGAFSQSLHNGDPITRLDPKQVMQLQRLYGNHITRQILQRSLDPSLIQRQQDMGHTEANEQDNQPPARTEPIDLTIHFEAQRQEDILDKLHTLTINHGLPESAYYSFYRGIDFQFSNIQTMVTEIKQQLATGEYYLRKLTIIGHGSQGSMPDLPGMTLGKLDEEVAEGVPYSDLLVQIKPFFGPDSMVRFEVCQFGQGPEGHMFIQQLADLWGVPISAQTGYVSSAGDNSAIGDEGFEIIVRPGEELETPAAIVAEQIYQFLTASDSSGDTAKYVVNMLYRYKDHKNAIPKIVASLAKKGYWPTVYAALKEWSYTRTGDECESGVCATDKKGEKSLSDKIAETNILDYPEDPTIVDIFPAVVAAFAKEPKGEQVEAQPTNPIDGYPGFYTMPMPTEGAEPSN